MIELPVLRSLSLGEGSATFDAAISAYSDAIEVYHSASLSGPGWDSVLLVVFAGITAVATITVALVAYLQISALRDGAKRQNTLTFLLESESDRDILEGYNAYSRVFIRDVSRLTLRAIINDDFAEAGELRPRNGDYKKIIRILNLFELAAVGMKEDILEECILREWWADFYVASLARMYPLIMGIRIFNAGIEKLDSGAPAPMNVEALFNNAIERARLWATVLSGKDGGGVYLRYLRYFEQDLSYWAGRIDLPLNQIYDEFEALG